MLESHSGPEYAEEEEQKQSRTVRFGIVVIYLQGIVDHIQVSMQLE